MGTHRSPEASRTAQGAGPVMHQEMWTKAVVQDNVARLNSWGHHFVGPERGLSATGEMVEGRMANIGAIIARLIEVSGAKREV